MPRRTNLRGRGAQRGRGESGRLHIRQHRQPHNRDAGISSTGGHRTATRGPNLELRAGSKSLLLDTLDKLNAFRADTQSNSLHCGEAGGAHGSFHVLVDPLPLVTPQDEDSAEDSEADKVVLQYGSTFAHLNLEEDAVNRSEIASEVLSSDESGSSESEIGKEEEHRPVEPDSVSAGPRGSICEVRREGQADELGFTGTRSCMGKNVRSSTHAEQIAKLVQEERRASTAEQPQTREGERAQIGAKVRLKVIRDKGEKTKAKDRHKAKMIVVPRKGEISELLEVAGQKLGMPKAAKVNLAETGEEVRQTLDLENGAELVISSKASKAPAGTEPEISGTEPETRKVLQEVPHSVPRAFEEEWSLDALRESYRKRSLDRLDRMPLISEAERRRENTASAEAWQKTQGSGEYAEFWQVRRELPASKMRGEILREVEQNQVIVVSGATGSGKTTQIPQIILDRYIESGRGSDVCILCTQPRRISAVGVAERVAAERCSAVGDTVGYAIRLEQRRSSKTKLLFMTTGILLRRLTTDADLQGVTHVLVDEVHERDLQTDFVLVILRDLLRRRADLKLILMSATLEAAVFCQYFGNCPCLTIPGRTYPVTTFYLKDAQAAVKGKVVLPEASRAEARRALDGDQAASGDCREEVASHADKELAKLFGCSSERVRDLLSIPSQSTPIDYNLIVQLTGCLLQLSHASRSQHSFSHLAVSGGKKAAKSNVSHDTVEALNSGGAILVFLPGMAEISRTVGMMKRDRVLGDIKQAAIFSLHSSLPPGSQRAVFKRMSEGVTKIVVATNIAETSITIDDISFVIDAGRVNEMGYDPLTHMSCLREVWISKASAEQRKGRAGRVRAGQCWRLFDKGFHTHSMHEHTLPEIRRTSLEDLVLTVLLLDLGSPYEFLSKAVDPPAHSTVTAAINLLLEIEAISQRENGTVALQPLGYHLATLPLDVRLGKMLIAGALLDCLEPILTIAAGLSGKSPFVAPMSKQQEAWMAKQQYGEDKSDHLALVAVYKAWSSIRDREYQQRQAFCKQNFLSISSLENMDLLREQFRRNLIELGFVEQGEQRVARQVCDTKAIDYSANEYDTKLLKGILVYGLSPQVAKLVRPVKGKGTHFLSRDGEEVWLHPSSVNFQRVRDVGPDGREAFCLYARKVQTSKRYLHDVTFISPLSLILFGTNVRLSRNHGGKGSKVASVTVDGWISFKTREETSVLLRALKRQIDGCLFRKIADPQADHRAMAKPMIDCIRELMRQER